MVATLGIPFSVLHRNELGDELSERLKNIALPCVVAELRNGDIVPILPAEVLTECRGSVQSFADVLQERLQTS